MTGEVLHSCKGRDKCEFFVLFSRVLALSEVGSQCIPLPSDTLLLLLGDSEAFPGQKGCIIQDSRSFIYPEGIHLIY